MPLIGTINSFNMKADNWILYEEQLEQFFVINDIKDTESCKKRVSALLSLIGHDTYRILRDLCTPTLPKESTYEQLCTLLRKHFSPTTSVFRERIEFYGARQEENETVNEWYARIHNLSTNCEFGNNLQDILRDKFVCGVLPGKIRDRICEEKPTTDFSKLLELALNKESTMLADSKNINTVAVRKKVNKTRGYEKQKRVESGARSGDSSKAASKWTCKCCGKQHTGNQILDEVNLFLSKVRGCSVVGYLTTGSDVNVDSVFDINDEPEKEVTTRLTIVLLILLCITKYTNYFGVYFFQYTTLMTALAPVAYTANSNHILYKILDSNLPLLQHLLDSYGVYQLLPHSQLLTLVGRILCNDYALTQPICETIVYLYAGYSTNFNTTLLPVILTNTPAGASMRMFYHYIQLAISGQFQMYDFGQQQNLIRYGQASPPKLDLTKVTLPSALYYSKQDALSAAKDVELLAADLRNLVRLHLVEGYSHLDYLWAKNVNVDLYQYVVETIKSYSI
ncbi:hypothetical protein PPYR_10022 [Photinus pyralis]|uniref:Retrotransposon gag domain-containing protein n=1 Tax=Photinus pyralis TaxID=7054 RepID=A0A5N4AF77_PHOPY|nr:hypothetical protein PPYR_10022 [Photinus pyralis]